MEQRKIWWMRKHKRTSFEDMIGWVDSGGSKHAAGDGVAALGIERVHDYPAYDNGMFVVVDTVKDVEWSVLRMVEGKAQHFKTVPLDKYEAIRLADEYKDSEDRAAREDEQIFSGG